MISKIVTTLKNKGCEFPRLHTRRLKEVAAKKHKAYRQNPTVINLSK